MKKTRKTLPRLLAVAAAMALTACGHQNSEEEMVAVPDSARFTLDLELYELQGPVKKVTKTSYFDVTATADGEYVIDSLGPNTFKTVIRFSPDGHYRPKDGERIRRDDQGRITRWENRKPTVGKVPLGVARDTLEYRRMNSNMMISDGMGQYAVMVYDDRNRITGQYTVPRINKNYTCAFNIYKHEDQRGNWTERVTVWSTQGVRDSLPSLHFSIDKREIEYFKEK